MIMLDYFGWYKKERKKRNEWKESVTMYVAKQILMEKKKNHLIMCVE